MNITKEKEVVARFAPSPTGSLHIGGARTALFNYLFSINKKGTFFLRIEDTDLKRNKKSEEKKIISQLEWIKISPGDFSENNKEIPTKKKVKDFVIKQSERVLIYWDYLKKLVEEKKAYYCFCTKKELEEEKKILKKEKKKFSIQDVVYIKQKKKLILSLKIIKSM